MELADLFAALPTDIAAIQERLAVVAAEVGLPLNLRSRIFNSRRAQELGKLAQKMGLMEPFQESVYRAYFVEGRNIALLEEVLSIAQRAGVPGDEARRALEEGLYAREVDEDWRRSRLLGVSGVPAFLYNKKVLVGFRPYQDLVSLLEHG